MDQSKIWSVFFKRELYIDGHKRKNQNDTSEENMMKRKTPKMCQEKKDVWNIPEREE